MSVVRPLRSIILQIYIYSAKFQNRKQEIGIQELEHSWYITCTWI